MLRFALLLVLAQASLGQVVSLGQCPNVTAMNNFEAEKVSFVENLEIFSSLTGWEIFKHFSTWANGTKWKGTLLFLSSEENVFLQLTL